MRPAECIAVVLSEDGTGKVILSGSRANCDLAARAENEKIGIQSGCVAVYDGLRFSDCGSLVAMDGILEKRRAAKAATAESLRAKTVGLQSRRSQIRVDQVANERATKPSAETSKTLAADLATVTEDLAATVDAVATAEKLEAAEREKTTESAGGKKSAKPAEQPAAGKTRRKRAGSRAR